MVNFDRVCKRRKLKVSLGKNKMMDLEWARGEVFVYVKPYSVKEETREHNSVRYV